MSTADRIRDLIAPLLAAADLELYDVELNGGVVKILVDRPGGADIDAIARLSRAVSRALDEHDPIAGAYTLEVSTPGLERPLRTAEHFGRSVGLSAKVKTKPGTPGDRRIEGTITAADEATFTIEADDGEQRTLRYEDIERARTTFEWGGAAKQERKARS